MCDTGYTIKHAMQALIAGGAKSVYAIVSHGSFLPLRLAAITSLFF